jgi:hypothetical protein
MKKKTPKKQEKVMTCPMCDTVLTWNPTPHNYKHNDNEHVTHIYVCPECPFIGLEYFTTRNLVDLIGYLSK